MSRIPAIVAITRRPELRFLTLGPLGVLVMGIMAGAWWWSPYSPVALERPAKLVAAGQPAQAAAAYGRLAQGWGPSSLREQAAWLQAGLTGADQPELAVERLRAYVQRWPTAEHTAQAYARLAVLYSASLQDPQRAASSWALAAATAPDDPLAGRWLLFAGRTWTDLGQQDRAGDALTAAASYETQAPAALLALGRLSLRDDPATAYEHYDAALRVARSPADIRLSRLGRATALERLEHRDAALAEVDEAIEEEGPDAALFRRQLRLRKDR